MTYRLARRPAWGGLNPFGRRSRPVAQGRRAPPSPSRRRAPLLSTPGGMVRSAARSSAIESDAHARAARRKNGTRHAAPRALGRPALGALNLGWAAARASIASIKPLIVRVQALAVGHLDRRAVPHQQGPRLDIRRALYEAASAMLTRYQGKTALKSWGQKITKRCHKKAVVAVARKLAVIMHAMWRDGTIYADRPHAGRRADRQGAHSFWASAHDVRGSLQPQTGVRLNAQGDPLRWMRTGADHRKREARYLACGRSDPGPRSNARDAAPPIHADMRRDGSTTAQTVPNPPSMSAEDCTAHQDSQPEDGSARRPVRRRAASRKRANQDSLENRRRRWPEREKRPRLRRQDKRPAVGRRM